MSANSALTEEQLEALANDMSGGAHAVVLREVARLQLENKYLKRHNLRIWGVAGILALLLAVTFLAGLQWFPKYRYIATTNNEAICEVTTDSSPKITAATVTDFAKEGVINANSYDYVNYRESLNYATNKWFTERGRKEFLKSLDESGNLERVIKGRFILRTMATRVPQLEETGKRGSKYYWLVQVPIAIEFYSGGEQQPKSRQDFLASVTVLQEPASAVNVKGIAVDSISLSPFVRSGK